MGLRTLIYTAILSGSAVLIGVVLVNVVKPGEGLPKELTSRIIQQEESKTAGRVKQAQSAKSLRDTLVDLIPENPIQEHSR